jgi:hypothetical protein
MVNLIEVGNDLGSQDNEVQDVHYDRIWGNWGNWEDDANNVCRLKWGDAHLLAKRQEDSVVKESQALVVHVWKKTRIFGDGHNLRSSPDMNFKTARLKSLRNW